MLCATAMKQAGAILVTSTLVACAPVTPIAPLSAAIRTPAGESFAFETRATGVQIYECATDPAAGNRAAWVFKAPEADLYDRTGRKIGKHYAGPTWEGNDGSTVVAAVQGRQDAPNADAIPWLLLAAKTNGGMGRFAATSSIQRLDTAGGTAPIEPCTTATLGAQRRVPYTATYYFYRSKSAAL